LEHIPSNTQTPGHTLNISMKNLFTLLMLFLFASCGLAQPGQWNTKNKKAIKLVEQGMEATRRINPQTGRPDFSTALEYIDKAIAKDPNFSDAYFLKAEYCLQSGNATGAIEAYTTLLSLPTFHTSTGYVYFDLAALELGNGMYDEAYEHAKKYATFKNAPEDMSKENAWMIKTCEFAIDAKKNPVPFDPVNVGSGVNSFDPEYFPTLTVDQSELLYTRLVTGRGDPQEDFFISKDLDGYWNTGEPMPNNINTTFNEGAPTFAPDGRTLIFVGCAIDRVGYGPGRRGYGSCDLFITEKRGNEWKNPINLPGAVNTQHWETQPSLSSDGKTLYFIRGLVRNTGGRNKRNGDIYVSKLQEDGTWGKAEKLPPNINTPYSESSVLIHPDGRTLYFSSNGHLGMGGYDLYMTQLQDDGSWSDPVNLGYPINTHHDENSLLVFADGKLAIFASDRPGGLGSLDLYEFEMPKSIQPTKTIYMTGTVYDVVTNKKLGAKFRLVDLETGKEVVSSESDPINGSFLVSLPINKEYALFVNRDGYNPYSVHFNLTVPENSNEPYHRDVPLVPVKGTEEEIALANVFFDLDKATLRKESFVELNEFAGFLKRHPDMKIELQGHTDAQGDDAHNLDLSKRRAKAVYDYLVSQGVGADQMTHKGYGETKPSKFKQDGKEIIRTEEWINTLSSEKEKKDAHQQNRRTAYIVLPN
jgi:outer membrane protein OmpA-like peptidoglycan-associated protein